MSGFEDILNIPLHPFLSWSDLSYAITNGFRTFVYLDSKGSVFYAFTGFALAMFLYFYKASRETAPADASVWKYLFPGSVYLHKSALVDYKFVAFDLTLKYVIYMPLIFWFVGILDKLIKPISFSLPVTFIKYMSYPVQVVVTTVLVLVFADLVIFVAHYLLHNIAFLWYFHEVHHSAEVLTPVTAYRFHPVESVVGVVVSAFVSVFAAKTYATLSDSEIAPLTIFGLNVVVFFTWVFGVQLRHTHIWLSFGNVLNHIFISPAQHQIHHSIEARHWNKNYGFTLAIWDWAIGSLYVPREREEFKFGVPNTDVNDFSTVPRLYFLPFLKSARKLWQIFFPLRFRLVELRSRRYEGKDKIQKRYSNFLK
jgi:sterol desaturase/sphingolipid hydroxylase (fatty acid hydroxylase superfamily)